MVHDIVYCNAINTDNKTIIHFNDFIKKTLHIYHIILFLQKLFFIN